MDLEGLSYFFHVWSPQLEKASPAVEIQYSIKWTSMETMKQIWFDHMKLNPETITEFLYENEQEKCIKRYFKKIHF